MTTGGRIPRIWCLVRSSATGTVNCPKVLPTLVPWYGVLDLRDHGGVPLLVGQALEVRGPPERRDRAEQFAGTDGDVQRQPVEQLRTGVGVQAADDVGLESRDGPFDGPATRRPRLGTTPATWWAKSWFTGREVANDDPERGAVDGAGLDGGDLPNGASEWCESGPQLRGCDVLGQALWTNSDRVATQATTNELLSAPQMNACSGPTRPARRPSQRRPRSRPDRHRRPFGRWCRSPGRIPARESR